jgi:hypothetical protein
MASTPSFGWETELSIHLCGVTYVRFRSSHRQHINLPSASVVLLGAMAALPACFLCIARRLEAMTSFRNVEQKNQTKSREAAFESVTCFLLPVLYLGLRESHRHLAVVLMGLISMQIPLFRTIALL